jgi:transcriptional regulator with XRE-family HTH domain
MQPVSLESIGAKLREARTRKGYSVDQISKLISVARKNIELIEEGISPGLPEPYVRGIVTLYARQVGLTVEEPAEAHPPVRAEVPVFVDRPPRRPVHDDAENPFADRESAPDPRQKIFGALAILMIVGLAVSIFWIGKEKSARPVEEISFAEAVREREAKYAEEKRRNDSISAAQPWHARFVTGDSLTLLGRTTNSINLKIGIDRWHLKPYLLPANFSMEWRARKSFSVIVDSSRGLELFLNGMNLGPLWRSNRPPQHVTLSWATVEKLQGLSGR